MNGASHYLDYEIELNSFAVEYYPNGVLPALPPMYVWEMKKHCLRSITHTPIGWEKIFTSPAMT